MSKITCRLAALVSWPVAAMAQTVPGIQVVPDVDVVASSPLSGSGGAVPQAAQTVGSAQIVRTGVPSLTAALLEDIAGTSVNDTSGNEFQPDILFHGYTASPVTGTAQGLAVYVNGARFNEPFGDTVNWDLIVPAAIARTQVQPADPVFGLNALGGSVSVRLKDGFTTQGGEITGYGGSFGRASGVAEYGRSFGNTAIYIAGDVTHDDGYRDTSRSDLFRIYTDLGWRLGDTELHLDLGAADTKLGNPGATPVQALDANPSAIFTGPNTVGNKYVSVNLNGTSVLSDTLSVQGLAYFQNLTQRVVNGATTQFVPCADGSGALVHRYRYAGDYARRRGGARFPAGRDLFRPGVGGARFACLRRIRTGDEQCTRSWPEQPVGCRRKLRRFGFGVRRPDVDRRLQHGQ